MTKLAPDRAGRAAEIVALDEAGEAYGICLAAPHGAPSWVIFTGERAGLRAYAYADANFEDVKTGRLGIKDRRDLALAMSALAS